MKMGSHIFLVNSYYVLPYLMIICHHIYKKSVELVKCLLQVHFVWLVSNSLGVDTHTNRHIFTRGGKKQPLITYWPILKTYQLMFAYHYVLFKVLQPACMKYRAQGKSKVVNIAWGKAKWHICHDTLTKCCINTHGCVLCSQESHA